MATKEINPNLVVKVKVLNGAATLPYKNHKEDFCYDVVATSREEVAPNVYRYGTGLAFQIERKPFRAGVRLGEGGENYYAEEIWLRVSDSHVSLSLDFRPRSSVWKTGMVLSNGVGTIDEGYSGEVFAVFYHVMPNMPIYKVGERIGQIKLGISLPVVFRETNYFRQTSRGADGYGSTGK